MKESINEISNMGAYKIKDICDKFDTIDMGISNIG